jgi:hypothetical protein
MNQNRTNHFSFSRQILLVSITISVFGMATGYGQMPMLPFPMGKGAGPAPVTDTGVQKVLIAGNCKTGKTDTILQGSYIKLWVRLPQAKNKLQPLIRIDFNRHTFYYESNIVAITDSSIVLAGKPVIPLPLPVPHKKILLDTIPLHAITAFRSFNKNSQMTITSSLMMPAMNFMPSEFITFPYMLYMMPANGIVLGALGNAFFPMRRIKTSNPKYRLWTGEKTMDTIYSTAGLIYRTDMPYEWEIDKYDRWQQAYTRASRILNDRIFLENTSNKILSGTIGFMFFPGFVKGAEDTKTNVYIPGRSIVLGLSSERYITQKDRLGMEFQFSSAPRSMSATTYRFSAGFGSITSIASYIKIGLGGLYGKSRRTAIFNRWASLSLDTADSKVQFYRSIQRLKQITEPQFYFLFGGGAINTTILKIKGSISNMNSLSTTDYSQKKFSLQAGLGASSRLGQRFLYDMSLKYIWSPNYTPSIGGLNSYSGFKLQFNIGYVYGPAFAKKRRMLAALSEKIK